MAPEHHYGDMIPASVPSFLVRTLACWNWKCALLSAVARSLVYLAAMARPGQVNTSPSGGLSIMLVEMAYVTVTAGLYAGMQQKALSFRSRSLRNLTVVVGVPGLAQFLDWLLHRAAGASVPGKATLVVCVFAGISAMLHLHLMSRGAFLTGSQGRPLFDDFRRIPRLVAELVGVPIVMLSTRGSRVASIVAADPGT